jgi:sec-independent protein translocase protein TatA
MLLSTFQLSISPEWIIIGLLALFLIFGTKKTPQVSKTIGKAIGEYHKAQEILRREIQDATSGAGAATTNKGLNLVNPRINGPVASELEKLQTIAKSLGIDYEGKSDDEIRMSISNKLQNTGA